MKKHLLAFIIIATSTFSNYAQNYRLWATYYGGAGQEFANGVTTDASGNVYLAGSTGSATGISTPGAYQTTSGGSTDAYLVKFNGAGTRLWATYFGGPDVDLGYGIKTDAAGNIFLTGYTYSTTNIATATAHQPNLNGATTRDAFLAKFSPSGSLLWATYYGGENYEQGFDVATDAAGSVYMCGITSSTLAIGTAGTFQPSYGGGGFDDDIFVAKFDANGTRLWGTYIGDSGYESGAKIATDNAGNVFVGGNSTSTTGIATPGSFKSTLTGSPNAFLMKINSTTGARIWATYYGGVGPDNCTGVTTDPSGNIYLAGSTMSSTDIASGGFQNTWAGNLTTDAYLVKFNTSGGRIWGTYYGGLGEDEGGGVATDSYGNVFLSGDSYTTNVGYNMATALGYQPNLGGLENQFLAAFSPNGLRYSATYYGGTHEEGGNVAVNTFGDIYLTGDAVSTTGISSAGSHQPTYGGALDGYLVKFSRSVPIIEVIVPNDSIPPPGPSNIPPKIYVSVSIYNGGGITISNGVLKNFSHGEPLPASGTSIISFNCDFTGDYSNGGPSTPVTCTAIVKMKVDYSYTSGTTRVFDTELLQLDLISGTLPAGVVLRESPTIPSYGQIVIKDIGGSQYKLSSYFNLFTELSTDYGANWLPNQNSPARVDLTDSTQAAIPTLGEWGLIALSVLMLGAGGYFIRKS